METRDELAPIQRLAIKVASASGTATSQGMFEGLTVLRPNHGRGGVTFYAKLKKV
jgi:hypothetical protein